MGTPRKPSEAGCVGRRRGNEMERMLAVRRAQRNGVCPDADWEPQPPVREYWKSWYLRECWNGAK